MPVLTTQTAGTFGPCENELARLAAHLQRTREEERAALARELHDELGAILTAARLDLAWLAAQPCCTGDTVISTRIEALQRVLRQGIELKRRIIEDLHPTILVHLGLAAALEHMSGETRSRFVGRLEADIDPTVLVSQQTGLALYRVAQEALTNAMKYGGASRVRLSLSREGRRAVLRVQDDGKGFNLAIVGADRHGLMGMRHRMLAVRGQLEIETSTGLGTLVVARATVSARRHAAAPDTAAQANADNGRRHAPPARIDGAARVRHLHGPVTMASHPSMKRLAGLERQGPGTIDTIHKRGQP